MKEKYLITFPNVFEMKTFKELTKNEHLMNTETDNSTFCTVTFTRTRGNVESFLQTVAPNAKIILKITQENKHKYITIQSFKVS